VLVDEAAPLQLFEEVLGHWVKIGLEARTNKDRLEPEAPNPKSKQQPIIVVDPRPEHYFHLRCPPANNP
jgi:hypothetical protein